MQNNKEIKTFKELFEEVKKLYLENSYVKITTIKEKYTRYWKDGINENKKEETKIIEFDCYSIKFRDNYYWILHNDRILCDDIKDPKKIYNIIKVLKLAKEQYKLIN